MTTIANAYGLCPPISRIEEAIRGAALCESQQYAESDWNCRVHADVLKLAFGNDTYDGKLDWLTVTHASIQPTSLLPKNPENQTVNSKMVNFVVYLEHDAEMERVAVSHRFEKGIFSHTYDYTLQNHAIAISIKTGPYIMDEDTALAQLCMWASAHLAKLDELVNKNGRTLSGLPFLPLILVQGHIWTLFAVTKEEGKPPVLWGREVIGSTSTAFTTYGLVAALQKLGQWCENEFRQWFRENIVQGFLDEEEDL